MLLAEGRRAVTVSSTAPFTAVDATGATYRLPKGALTLRSDLALPSEAGPGTVSAMQPLVIRPAKKALLALDGRVYRGKLELVPQGEFLRVVNVVALESYLQGVVAGEVPYSWPAEVLKAQAVAARSYALANLVKGKPFDLYSDVRSQVYLGSRGREGVDEQGGRGHGRRGRPLRREGRDDVLLLDVGRQDRECARRLRLRRAVPRVAAGSVGQGLAVPPLGPGSARRAHRAGEARRRPRASSTSRRRRDAVRACSGRSSSRRRRAARPFPRRSSGRRSGCARRGSRSA